MQISSQPTLKWAAPVVASLDIERTIAFYARGVGFCCVYSDQGVYGIVSRDDIYNRANLACSMKTAT